MDIKELNSKLRKSLPGAVLESRPLGSSRENTVWIEMKAVQQVARYVSRDSELEMDFLEFLSVMELEGSVVVSYFLRSTRTQQTLVLRGSLLPTAPEAEVDLDSVEEIWPMASRFEAENSELFGIRFGGRPIPRKILPEGWQGFPLRKGYVFPSEVLGLPHLRAVGRTAPDEHGVSS